MVRFQLTQYNAVSKALGDKIPLLVEYAEYERTKPLLADEGELAEEHQGHQEDR